MYSCSRSFRFPTQIYFSGLNTHLPSAALGPPLLPLQLLVIYWKDLAMPPGKCYPFLWGWFAADDRQLLCLKVRQFCLLFMLQSSLWDQAEEKLPLYPHQYLLFLLLSPTFLTPLWVSSEQHSLNKSWDSLECHSQTISRELNWRHSFPSSTEILTEQK